MNISKNYGSFGFDTLVENFTPGFGSAVITGIIAAFLYVPLVDGYPSFWPIAIAAILLPIMAAILLFMLKTDGVNIWFWGGVLNAVLPLLMSASSFVSRLLGFTGFAGTLHELRWWSLLLPYAVILTAFFCWFACKQAILTWFKVEMRWKNLRK